MEESKHSVLDILNKFGRYQVFQYFFVSIPIFFVTIININYIFVVEDVDLRCKVPKCETSSPEINPPWWDSGMDKCHKYYVNTSSNGNCTVADLIRSTEECTEWVYNTPDSVMAKLNLACQPWKVNLVGSVHNIGLLISIIIAGYLTDTLGRKPVLIFFAIGGAVGYLKSFVSSYYIYISIEFLEALLSGGTYPAATVMMIEIAGQKNRVIAGIIFAYALYLGETSFALLAMVSTNLRTLMSVIYLPPLTFIFLSFLIKESPRWQILNGKLDQARNNINYIAKLNKCEMKAELTDEYLRKSLNTTEDFKGKENYIDIFKSKELMKRVLVATVSMFTVSFIYYGLMVNSVWLPGNKYMNFMWSTIMSFPGELMAYYLMKTFGRKRPIMIGFLANGLLCAGSAYVPDDHNTMKIVVFLIGKMVISICYTSVLTYIMELFPTSVRGSLLGICNIASRIGGILAPMTPGLTKISPAITSVLFCGCAIISGLMISITPETKDAPMLDTIAEINAYARKENKDIIVTKF